MRSVEWTLSIGSQRETEQGKRKTLLQCWSVSGEQRVDTDAKVRCCVAPFHPVDGEAKRRWNVARWNLSRVVAGRVRNDQLPSFLSNRRENSSTTSWEWGLKTGQKCNNPDGSIRIDLRAAGKSGIYFLDSFTTSEAACVSFFSSSSRCIWLAFRKPRKAVEREHKAPGWLTKQKIYIHEAHLTNSPPTDSMTNVGRGS